MRIIAAADLLAALAVSGVDLKPYELAALLHYLREGKCNEELTSTRSAGIASVVGLQESEKAVNLLTEEEFICTLYALSIQNREVASPSLYAVFPDSDFTAETASQWFKWKRRAWTVRAIH
jgi:hypothetical protein